MEGNFVEECFLEGRHVGGRFVLASDTQTLHTQGNTLTTHHTVGYPPPHRRRPFLCGYILHTQDSYLWDGAPDVSCL